MKRIMVVDDSNITRKMITSVLAQAGYSIDNADNGAQALEKLFQSPCDLIITDMNMPQMDGMELLSHLRHDPHYRSAPIIVLSSNSGPEEIKRATQAGANLYLIKPTPPEKLLECVRTLLKAG